MEKSSSSYQLDNNPLLNNKSARDLLALKKKIQQKEKEETPREREKSLVSLRKIHDFLENSIEKDHIDVKILRSTFQNEYFTSRNLFTIEPNIWTPRSMDE